jgi:glycosyltransferase involved in cell wall biosynthesis
MRGALILFEGLPPTVIDSQVLTHVRLARERLGIDIAVVAVACSRSLFESSQARLERVRQNAGGEVYLSLGLRPALPGSVAANRRLLAGALDRLGPLSFVHARADYAAAVAGPLARARNAPMLWDCRGDARAELRERFGDMPTFMKPLVAMRLALMQRELKIAGEYCAGASFVTPQLRDLMAGFLSGQPSWIIPCVALETEFFFDPALRERVRDELRIGAEEVVYIYSGSLAAYQGFGEVIAVFRSARAAKQNVRLVILTPDIERARRACVEFPAGSVICRSVEHAQVNSYLNAADFGMLLRESTPVNHVAFPTKFAEYALTGLKIVMKNSPPSCVDVARALGNHVEPGRDAAPFSPPERAHYAGQATSRLGRLAAMATYAAIYKSLGSAHLGESRAAMPA